MNDLAKTAQSISPASKSSTRLRLWTLSLALIAGCKGTPAPKPLDDASLTQAIQSSIAADPSLASDSILVSVQQGVATLTGTASSDNARNLAGSDAGQISGIRTVVNNLTVASASAQSQTAAVSQSHPATAPSSRSSKSRERSKPAVAARPTPLPPPTQQAEASPPAPIERVTPHAAPAIRQAPPAPEIHSLVLPADTAIPVRLSQTLDSATAQEGDTFSAVLASDILADGRVALRQGTAVTGRVDTVHEAGHFKGSSLLMIQLTSIQARATTLQVSTDTFSKAGTGRGKNSAEKIGGGAAVGAILGGIFGGGKGAGIGAAAGGGLGAGAQAITRGQQVQIPAESIVRFRLTTPVTVRASGAQPSSGEPDLQRHDDPPPGRHVE